MTAVEEALQAATEDVCNAFTAVHEDAAGDRGREGPLSGVPIGVKDLVDDRGRTTTAGSAFYRHEATSTAPALARLRDAGAVVIGRTGLHEFAFGFSSENPWFGPVRNPWDHSLSPGGSSGGSAAAVAGGVVPVAIGTDTGGSVRVPAAMCAVYGLKVTHGLIPLEGVFPLVPSLDTVGALTSDLNLLHTATAAMAGPRWPEPGTTQEITRLVVPEEWLGDAPLSAEVSTAFNDFVAAAGEAGLAVEQRSLPLLAPSPHQLAVIAAEAAAVHGEWRREGRPYGEDVGERIDHSIALSADATAQAEGRRWRTAITETTGAATGGGTAIVTPSVADLEKRIGNDFIDGRHYRGVISYFSAPVNATGHPAISLPVAGGGRRPSVQLIGARHSEPWLLELARRLEEAGVVGVGRLPS